MFANRTRIPPHPGSSVAPRRTLVYAAPAAVFAFALLSEPIVLAGGTKSAVYKGRPVDRLCAMAPDSIAADGVDLKVGPEMHSLHCALMPPCAASRYGIYAQKDDGGCEFYEFDKKGSALAEEHLEKTSKRDRIGVEVTGALKGDTIRVKTLSGRGYFPPYSLTKSPSLCIMHKCPNK